jgi:hypothetical protein
MNPVDLGVFVAKRKEPRTGFAGMDSLRWLMLLVAMI